MKCHQCKLQTMITMSASNVIALVDDWKKHHQCKLQWVKTILGTSRSRKQQLIAAYTRAQTLPELALIAIIIHTKDFNAVMIAQWRLAFWALLKV